MHPHIAPRQTGTCVVTNRPRAVGWDESVVQESHSLLTQYLIEGLKRERTDLSQPGRVTVEEWFIHVQKQMVEHGLPEAWKWDVGLEGAWVIVEPEKQVDRTSKVPEGLRRTFKELAHMFRDGLVIPFLGAAAIPTVPLVEADQAEQEPLLDQALAHKLAEIAESLEDVPEPMQQYPLTILAQYRQTYMMGGRTQFYNELKRSYPQPIAPGPMHRLLVQQEKPLLVISSSYDTALEQVFDEQKKPYAVVTHISHTIDPENLGKVVVQYSDRDVPEIELSDRLGIDLDRYWVFYKIQGTFDLFIQGLRGREEIDSILISEEDYFSFLSRVSDQYRTIPTLFTRSFQLGIFLFCGYWMSDWNFRALVYILWQKRIMRQLEGYAVRHNATQMEARFWKGKNLDLITMQTGDFASALAEEMRIRI